MAVPNKSVIRKRITRSGSGAYSIYLPKKWVDSWSKAQKEKNEVTLYHLGNHLVITPIFNEMKRAVELTDWDVERLRQIILSSYVRGYTEVEITGEKFKDEEIEKIRSYMRLLDEKLIPTVSDHRIAFKSHVITDPTNIDENELLSMLFTKTEESLGFTAELLSFFDLNPSRAVHTLKLIYALEHQDIDRLTYQIYRRMSNFELPTEKLSDLFYMILIVSTLERIGDTLFSIAGFICNMYGFKREKLDYPLELLKKEVETKNISFPKPYLPLKKLYSKTLKSALRLLGDARPIVIERDGQAAFDYKFQVRNERFAFEDENFELTDPSTLKIPDTDSSMLHLYTIRLGYRIRELLRNIESLGKRTCLFYYTETFQADHEDR